MEKFEFNACQYIALNELKTSQINEEIFIKIKDKIITILKQLNIETENLSLYYERHNDSSSILAIKLINGDDLDINNYMVNWCMTNYYSDNKILCDVGFDAKAKVGQIAMAVANTITEDMIMFFEDLEKDLLNKNLSSIEFSLRIPLCNHVEKFSLPKENKFKSKIKSLFKK